LLARNTTDANVSSNAPSWVFQVKDQFNGVASTSRLTGAAAVPGSRSSPYVFMMDAERRALTLSERDDKGVWRMTRNLELPLAEFSAIHAVRLGSNRFPVIVLEGLNTLAYLPLEGQSWTLNELDGYESPIRDARLMDIITGDLNNDGRKDLVFIETGRNYIDLVTLEGQRLVPANRWQVFEERTFRNRRSDLPEPREALVGDFTGDRRNDLVILVHDRILLYPQE
jgi:hypothetical protein